jgi:alpha-tubulin suppressor-like RCC1 family protein
MDFLFDDILDTTSITNVLLIDKDTPDYEVFYNSCNGTTFPIVYSRRCSRNDLLQLLNNKFSNINRLCFVFSLQPVYEFLNNEFLFRHDETTPYSENVTFIINLINQFNISTVDYLACDTLNYEHWQNYYNIILSNTTAIVGASNDRTGNLKYGGDWMMESTGLDIQTIYFSSQIQNYQKLLDSARHNFALMSDGTVFGWGENVQGTLGDGTFLGRSQLTQMINTTGKTPASISCGRFHTVVLMTDGTIFGTGYTLDGSLGIGNPGGVSRINVLTQMINTTGKTPVKVSCGDRFTIVLMSDGAIYGCGLGSNYQHGSPNVTSFTLRLVTNNTGKTPIDVTTGTASTIILMSDGSIYQVGVSLTEIINNTGKTPVAISSSTHTLVLMNDGTVFGIGNNPYGELMTGDTINRSTLTQMINNTGKTPVGIHTEVNVSYVLMNDKTIFSAGFSNEGQSGRTNAITASFGQVVNNSGQTPAALNTHGGGFLILMENGSIYTNNMFRSSHFPPLITNNTGKTPVALSDQVAFKQTTLLSNFSIPTKTFGNSPFTITPPTSNSTGSFSYSSSNTSVATISGNTITIVGAGTTTITASQAATETRTAATTTSSFQVNKATTTISSFSIPTKTFGNTPFTITSPTSNSNGSFSYSSSNTSVATISGNTITIVGVGSTTITASQAETTSYTSGTLTTTFQVSKATPSITGFSIPTKTYGDSSFTITQPTSNSTGTFSYSSSNTSVATISGNTITIVGPGTAIITASQGESTNFTSGTQTASFQVDKITPSITDFSLPTRRYGTSPFIITPPTSTSNGTFSYSSSNTSVANVSGNVITIVGAGTATITSTQAESAFYKSGTLTTSIQVSKAIPSISNFSIPTKNYGDSSFTITPPTSNSNGSFSYISSDTSVANISGNTVTIVGVGTTTITATQAETTNYISGTIIASFQVSRAVLSISDFSISTKTYGDSPFTITPPASNSNGSFSYISADPSVATISGDTITIVGVGTASILAVQEKTSNYASGTITTTFQVDKATPSISGFSIQTKTVDNSPFPITQPSSNSNGTFSYISTDPSVVTISGNTVTIVGAGTVTLLAIQEATSNYISGITSFDLQVLSA